MWLFVRPRVSPVVGHPARCSRTGGHKNADARTLSIARAVKRLLQDFGPAPACTVNISGDVVLNAYLAEPKFAGATLSDFAEFPGCVQDGSPGYCPPTGS